MRIAQPTSMALIRKKYNSPPTWSFTVDSVVEQCKIDDGTLDAITVNRRSIYTRNILGHKLVGTWKVRNPNKDVNFLVSDKQVHCSTRIVLC